MYKESHSFLCIRTSGIAASNHVCRFYGFLVVVIVVLDFVQRDTIGTAK